MNIGEELRKYEGQPITRQQLMEILRDYKRPANKIHELVSKEFLAPVKGGYIHGPALGIPAPVPGCELLLSCCSFNQQY